MFGYRVTQARIIGTTSDYDRPIHDATRKRNPDILRLSTTRDNMFGNFVTSRWLDRGIVEVLVETELQLDLCQGRRNRSNEIPCTRYPCSFEQGATEVSSGVFSQ